MLLPLQISLWGRKDPLEEDGHPLQCSCLENPMDRGAWRATVHGVAKSRTRLKWLSTHTHTHTSFQHKKERMCTMTNDLTSHLSLCSRPATPSCNSPHDCALTRLLKVWLAFLITSTNGSVSTRSPTRETDTISRGSAPTQVRLITIMFNQTLFFPLSSLKATISVISICLALQWNQFNKTQKSITARCAVFHTFEF